MANNVSTHHKSLCTHPKLFPSLTATKLQATTYLLGVAFFSISFLVFLNASISFVITDVIGQKDGVGEAVGTLGFADELLALVACPIWGLLSDKIGVRAVAVIGYCIVGVSLMCLVQSSNVYPQLLLGRLAFSIGGAACSTMVTAVLPSMLLKQNGTKKRKIGEERESPAVEHHRRDGSLENFGSASVSSELTITPSRLSQPKDVNNPKESQNANGAFGSKLAGFVGLSTGAGALLALGVFLPLPTRFRNPKVTSAVAVQRSFYVVGAIAISVAFFISFGLRNLPGEEGKGWRMLISGMRSRSRTFSDHRDEEEEQQYGSNPSYRHLIMDSLKLGFTDSSIGLGYLGGFVARASSVGISLFIPLFVNAYFVKSGLCKSSPDDLTDIKENCQRAYKLAAALSGIAETAALIAAPLFGYLGSTSSSKSLEWPLMLASAVGVLGYVAFGFIHNPDAFRGQGDSRWAVPAMIAIGISQIGAIVCSLAVLSKGINQSDGDANIPGSMSVGVSDGPSHENGAITGSEAAPLLPGVMRSGRRTGLHRAQLKGTIAGIYSLAGGAGILLLTKVGGVLFDKWTPGAPFFIMAVFNALLLVVVTVMGIVSIRGQTIPS